MHKTVDFLVSAGFEEYAYPRFGYVKYVWYPHASIGYGYVDSGRQFPKGEKWIRIRSISDPSISEDTVSKRTLGSGPRTRTAIFEKLEPEPEPEPEPEKKAKNSRSQFQNQNWSQKRCISVAYSLLSFVTSRDHSSDTGFGQITACCF